MLVMEVEAMMAEVGVVDEVIGKQKIRIKQIVLRLTIIKRKVKENVEFADKKVRVVFFIDFILNFVNFYFRAHKIEMSK